MPTLLQQTHGHQLVDGVGLHEEDAAGGARLPQRVTRDEWRPMRFGDGAPNARRIAARRSERLKGFARYAAIFDSRHRTPFPG
jgi:hypothetical protein